MESILEAERIFARTKGQHHVPPPHSRLDRNLARRLAAAAPGGQETVRRGSQPVPAGRQQPGRTGRLSRIEWRAGQGRARGSAHSYLGKNLTKLSDAEIAANRNGHSADAKADAAVGFAVKIVNARGHVSDADIKAVKDAGYDDAQVIEIVLHVALNTLTNYVNEVAKTAIDFPAVAARAA